MVRSKRFYALVAAAVLGVGGATYAIAGPDDLKAPKQPHGEHFKATLNGYQENPSISTTGYGEFRAWLVKDAAVPTLHYVFQYAGLEGGNSLFAHVHVASRGVNGGVSFFLCGGSTKPTPCPNVEGTVEGDIVAADVIGPAVTSGGVTTYPQGIEPGSFDEIIRMMQAGHSYANIHTTRWPGGEIRGQINSEDQKQFE